MPSLAKYQLDIGTPQEVVNTRRGTRLNAVRLDNHHIDFSITKSNDSKKNKASFKIYNLGEDQRRKISREAVLILRVGYGDSDYDVCYTGDIFDFGTENTSVDVITTVNCETGYKAVRNSHTTRTFRKGQLIGDALQTIITQDMGYPRPLLVHNARVDQAKRFGILQRFTTDYTINAPSEYALDMICKDHLLEWSINDGNVIRVNFIGDSSSESPTNFIELISPQTGLIGSPKPNVQNSNKQKKAPDTKFGYTVETILNPRLIPGDICKLQSRDIRGKLYAIQEVTHQGSWEGNVWKSVVKLGDTEAKEV